MKTPSTVALALLSGAAMVAATPISFQTHSASLAMASTDRDSSREESVASSVPPGGSYSTRSALPTTIATIITKGLRHVPVLPIISTAQEDNIRLGIPVVPVHHENEEKEEDIGTAIPYVPIHHEDDGGLAFPVVSVHHEEEDIGTAIPYVPIHHEDDGGLAFPVVPVDHHNTGTSRPPMATSVHKRSAGK